MINIRKSVVSTHQAELKNEVKRAIPFINSIQIKKIPRYKLNQGAENHYNENYKALLKEI